MGLKRSIEFLRSLAKRLMNCSRNSRSWRLESRRQWRLMDPEELEQRFERLKSEACFAYERWMWEMRQTPPDVEQVAMLRNLHAELLEECKKAHKMLIEGA